MSKPNTIPEFLAIIAGTIIGASVIGVFVSMLYEKANKSIKNKFKSNAVHASSIATNPTHKIADNRQSTEEKAKFKISHLFYQYCFSIETAKIFLEENDMRPTIARALYLSVLDKEHILELLFKLYLKKSHHIELEIIGHKFYKHNEYKFYLDVERLDIDKEVTFFEILRNGYANVKDADGNYCSIANEFIVYVKNTIPVAIFVIVTDPLLNKIVIREVFKNGNSGSIAFLDSNDDNQAIDFLLDFIKNK